jgi:hypothetical protein
MFPPYAARARRPLARGAKPLRQGPWPGPQDERPRCQGLLPEQRARPPPERQQAQQQPAGEFVGWLQSGPQPDEERRAQHRSVATKAA